MTTQERIDKMLKKSEAILNAGKQTNAEWLRQASDEELAEFIWQDRVEQSDWWYEQCGHTVEEVLEWLKKESAE